MRSKTVVAFAGVALLSGAGAFALTSREPIEADLSMDQARAIALEVAGGGSIDEAELEREGDLSIYSFDIRTDDGSLVEVEVDAMTGAVLRQGQADDDVEDEEDEGA